MLNRVFDFGATAAFCLYTVSHVRIQQDEENSNDLPGLARLARLAGAAASRSASVSLRNASFHIDLHKEEDVVPFYSSDELEVGLPSRKILPEPHSTHYRTLPS